MFSTDLSWQDHESLADISSDLGTCYFNSGKYDLAISTFSDALRITLLTESRESLEVADVLYKIASCHDSLCNYDAALEQFHEVKQLRETLFGIESGPVIQTMLRIGNILLGIGRIEMAQECFDEVRGRRLGDPLMLNYREQTDWHRVRFLELDTPVTTSMPSRSQMLCMVGAVLSFADSAWLRR